MNERVPLSHVSDLSLPGPWRVPVEAQPLYSFDGSPSQRSFAADVLAAGGVNLNRDAPDRDTARAAVLGWWGSPMMAHAFASISQSNVSTLNPVQPGQPVTGLPSKGRPLWSAVSSGQLSSLLSVVYPRVTSASTLVDTSRTEGNEPADGTFVATSADTANPEPISGKLRLNREVLDLGDTGFVDRLVATEMLRVFGETVEARLQVMLDALSVTALTIVGYDTGLDDDFVDALVPLITTAGGSTMSALVLDPTLYAAARRAKDSTGERMYDVGPGGVLALQGFDAVPAWALTSSPAKSYVFDPAEVHCLTTMSTLTFDRAAVSYVDLVVWGYSAEFCTRPASVRRLNYLAA
jgi:hypothetical protein